MMPAMTQRHRSAALAVTAVFVLLLAGLALGPHAGAHLYTEELALARDHAARLQRLVDRGPELRDRSAAIRSRQMRLKLLLAAETTGIAGAELQKFLLERVAHHAGKARTILVQPPQTDNGLQRISARLTVQIGIEGLRDLLHDLETGLPLLFISELSVRGPEDRAARKPGAMLEVHMHVGGFMPATSKEVKRL